MQTAALAFCCSVAVGAVSTRAVRVIALRYGAVDHALVSRKIHRRPVPRLGGIGIVLAFFAALLGAYLLDGEVARAFHGHARQVLGLAVGGLCIAVLGVYDDVRGAGASAKFAVQFAVAGLMYACGFRVDVIVSPFAPPIALGAFALPFTVLWVVGVINALNLVDGLDGLAGGVALFATVTLLAVAGVRGEIAVVVMTAALAGGVLGFLFYNFHPASIFMGDTGSMFLGLVLATTAIHGNEIEPGAVAMTVPIVALGLPIADTLLAMGRRVARGLPIFRGDRAHIHHRLLDRGLSHSQTVLVLYAAAAVLGFSALALAFTSTSAATWLLLSLAALGYVLLRRLGFLDLGRAPTVIAERRRNVLLRAVIRRASEELQRAATSEEVWNEVKRVGRFLGATCFGLGLARVPNGPLEFSEGFDRAPMELLRVRYGLMPERPGANYIELAFADGRTCIDRDTEIAIEMLCHHLHPAVERLESRQADVAVAKGIRASG